MAGIFSPLDSPAILIGGVEDHVHVLFNLSRSHALKEVVGKVKAESSAWIKKNSLHHDFYWQAGYGAFSVSETNVETVRKYIRNQEEHHRRISFQDEFRALCEKHGLEIDERYAWD
jgi:putative transposase